MINRNIAHVKYNNFIINILAVMMLLILLLISIVVKKNILLLVQGLLVGLIFIWKVYINEKRLMIFTILAILFTPTLSIFNDLLSNVPYFIIILLSIKLFEKKIILNQKIKFDKIIVLLTMILFLINVLSLIYNGYDMSMLLILFYSLKKFSFLILYLFFINVDISKKDIKINLNIIIIFAFLQFIVVAVQFAGGVREDALGGMFGESATGVMIQYLSIILIVITVFKENFSKLPFLDLIVMLLSLIYSAMGQVKVGFIVIPFIYVLALLLKGNMSKFVITVCVLFLSFSSIYAVFIKLYPNQDILLNLSSSEKYLQTAYGVHAVNRSGFLPLLERTVLDTTRKQLFGTGLASINPSKTDILQGPLIKQFSYLNIYFFALPYSISENGIIGTLIWLMIYIYILLKNIIKYVLHKNNMAIVNIVLIIDIFIFIFYNNSIFSSSSVILVVWFIISYFNQLRGGNNNVCKSQYNRSYI